MSQNNRIASDSNDSEKNEYNFLVLLFKCFKMFKEKITRLSKERKGMQIARKHFWIINVIRGTGDETFANGEQIQQD